MDGHDAHVRIVGERGLVMRRVTDADTDAMRDLLTAPEVVAWWGTTSEDDLRTEVMQPPDNTISLAIERDGTIIGLLQIVEEPWPSFRSAGIDIALAPEVHGHGYGPTAIRAACRYLIDVRGHHRMTIDPRVSNERAIAAYRKVGFQPVGVMRAYERTDDGAFHDALLMDLLADELLD